MDDKAENASVGGKRHLTGLDVDGFSNPRPFERVNYRRPLNAPWCDSPFLEQQIQEEKLSPELAALVRKYAQDGYVIIDPQIPESVLDGTIKDVEGRYREGGGGAYSSPGRIQDSWMFSENSRRIASDRAVLDLLYVLYRRQPIPFQTLNFPVGTQQRTHSDTIHFHAFPYHFMCGVWIALEDVDLTNGPLHYYPGSHRLPIYDMHDLGISASAQKQPYEYYDTIYENFVDGLMKATGQNRIELNVKKGQALIWAANLFHGGSPILDPKRTRNSQVTHYYFTDCVYTTPLLSDYVLGKGHARNVVNIKNKQQVSQFYNSHRIENPGKWPPGVQSLTPDPYANSHPLPIATQAPHRVVAWPRWDEPSDLRRIFGEFARVLAGRRDACLCLRFDPFTDRSIEEVVPAIQQIYQEVLQNAPLTLLLIDNPLAQLDWPRIGKSVTCAIAAGGPTPCANQDFIAALGVPVFRTGDELARHLGRASILEPAASPRVQASP